MKSSYQKLKEENLKLKEEIRKLVLDELDSEMIKTSYKFQYLTENVIFSGNVKQVNTSGDGIFTQMKNLKDS